MPTDSKCVLLTSRPTECFRKTQRRVESCFIASKILGYVVSDLLRPMNVVLGLTRVIMPKGRLARWGTYRTA